jgi:hypothetical protein
LDLGRRAEILTGLSKGAGMGRTQVVMIVVVVTSIVMMVPTIGAAQTGPGGHSANSMRQLASLQTTGLLIPSVYNNDASKDPRRIRNVGTGFGCPVTALSPAR